MYHPLLIFERHTGCLLAARLRRGTAASPARLVPLLLRLVLRLQKEFPGVRILLRADAGFPLPLLYEFCEFFGLQYVIGLPANAVFQRRAARLQRRLARRYRRTQQPQRSFSSFRHRAKSWSTCSACTCPCPFAQPRSKLCALGYSNSAPAFARRPAACASTWPAVGPFNVSSKPSHSPLTPVSPLPLVELSRSRQSKAELCPKNGSRRLQNASATEMKSYRPRLTALQPMSPRSPAHFSRLMNKAG